MSGSVEESTGEKQMFKISNNSQCMLPLQPIDQKVLGMRLGICLECLKIQSRFVLQLWFAYHTPYSGLCVMLCIFSAWFVIYNSTFGTDIFQVFLHWWGTASSSYSMCCSLATPLLNITKRFKFLYSKVAYAHYGKHVPWPSLAVSFQSRRVASITLKSGIQKCGRTLERIVPYMYCFGSWAPPPYIHLGSTLHISRDECSLAFPIWIVVNPYNYYCECNARSKREATDRGYLHHCCVSKWHMHTMANMHVPWPSLALISVSL